jgi:hypothetical protein
MKLDPEKTLKQLKPYRERSGEGVLHYYKYYIARPHLFIPDPNHLLK